MQVKNSVQLRLNQVGAASLITVIILAIILSTITTGLLRLSVQDARQATDDNLTNSAFYAAESGLYDAQRFIQAELADERIGGNNYILNGERCEPPQGETGVLGGAGYNVSYTCQLIDMTPTVIRNTIVENDVAQIPLSYILTPPDTDPTGIIIRWHAFGADGDGPVANLRTNKDLPAQGTGNPSLWQEAPAMIRAQLFSTPKTGNINRGNIGNTVTFFNPTAVIDADPLTDYLAADGEIINAGCETADPGTGYACEARLQIPNMNTQDYEVRLSSVYRSAEVEVSFDTGEEFTGVQALVDVTGRAADVYRRVQASVDLGGDSNIVRLLPSTAIRTAQDICKDIEVTATVQYSCP